MPDKDASKKGLGDNRVAAKSPRTENPRSELSIALLTFVRISVVRGRRRDGVGFGGWEGAAVDGFRRNCLHEGHTRLIGGIGGVLVDKGFAIGGAVMPDGASPNSDVLTSHVCHRHSAT